MKTRRSLWIWNWYGLVALSVAVGISFPIAAQDGASGKYVHFKWVKAADGVWLGISPPNSFISGNTVIISIPGGAFVVDPHITETTANEIIAKAKEVAGPVKYLVNTHLHNDHSQGNFAFKKAFPDVQIIAHANSCWGEREKATARTTMRVGNLPAQMVTMKENLAKITDPKVKADLEHVIEGNEIYLEDSKHLQWTYPDQCLNLKPGEAKVMTFGDRTIEIHYFGRAHTAGDLVVYLPKEKLLANGDLWMGSGGMPDFGRDGSGLEYGRTLRGVAQLQFTTVLPGHGEMMEGYKSLFSTMETVENLVQQVKASVAKGQYIDQTLEAVKLASGPPMQNLPSGPTLATYVPYMSGPAAGGFRRNVIRIYEEIELLKQRDMPLP